jgi:hypothetical protein
MPHACPCVFQRSCCRLLVGISVFLPLNFRAKIREALLWGVAYIVQSVLECKVAKLQCIDESITF